MSSHTYVYIGVYLVVDQWLESAYTSRECENGHRNRRSSRGDDRFCSECGYEIKEVPKTSKRRMSASDAAEEFGFDEDTFYTVDRGDEPCIWLGNETNDSLTKGAEYEGEFEINPDTISAAVFGFATKYAVPLGLLDDNNVDLSLIHI